MKILAISLLVFVLASCSQQENTPEALAKKSCGSCHLFPEPSLLDKRAWANGVLPEMKFRMGLNTFAIKSVPFEDHARVLKTLPSTPMVTEEEWKLIEQFYLAHAPDTLPPSRTRDTRSLTSFRVREIQLPEPGLPLITLLQYDSVTSSVYVGTRTNKIFVYDRGLNLRDSLKVESPPSSIALRHGRNSLISVMGIMDPNDRSSGAILSGNLDEGKTSILIDSLQRPVHLVEGDLTGDAIADLVVSEFGNFTGALTLYEQLPHGSYKRRTIDSSPGARRAIIIDADNDGRNDIIALMAQGDERIVLYRNEGNQKFTMNVLARFPPAYGVADFEFVDFNLDGHLDILLSNGDNADFSPILKPYHGIRLMLNDGKLKFREGWFEPMDGAFRALPYDFDNDGDLDIAAISYFPDFNQVPQNGFIYFEQTKSGFNRYTIEQAQNARWLVMDLLDTNSDGKMDIVLGSLDFPFDVNSTLYSSWNDRRTGILVLENHLF